VSKLLLAKSIKATVLDVVVTSRYASDGEPEPAGSTMLAYVYVVHLWLESPQVYGKLVPTCSA
jgi:hypothetical protein